MVFKVVFKVVFRVLTSLDIADRLIRVFCSLESIYIIEYWQGDKTLMKLFVARIIHLSIHPLVTMKSRKKHHDRKSQYVRD